MAATSHDSPRPAGPVRPPIRRGMVTVGLVFVLTGVLVLLDREGIGRRYLPEQLWPFVLIIAGIMRLTAAPPDEARRRSRRPGLGFLVVGCWGAINEFHVFGFDYGSSWPLLVIAAGVMIIWHAFDPVTRRRPRGE